MLRIGLQYFANKAPTEIATIDVAMVTVGASSGDTYCITTDTKIQVEPIYEIQEAVKLVVAGIVKAQKPEIKKMVGNKITLTDNVFLPEVVKLLQGGTIEFDDEDDTKIVGYTPPNMNATTGLGEVLTVKAYSAQYNSAGTLVQYECIEYETCRAEPVAFSSENGIFRAPVYVLTSTPAASSPPYEITYVAALPTVE